MSAEPPLVIGLDSSTQSTKAIAWDRDGNALAEGRADIALANPALGRFEQDPADWWRACTEALRACTAAIDASRIAGLAISNQRETMALVDERGEPTYPALTWLDERSAGHVRTFSESFGAERLHRITGRPPDVTNCLYRFAWLRDNDPAALDGAHKIVDVQCYLVNRLCGGGWRTGWISADPFGLYDMEAKRWSAPILEALGIDEGKLAEALAPGTRLGEVSPEAAETTGLPVGLPVYAAGGDGQCAGLGTDCTVPERAYVNLGTAMVAGVWSPDYRVSRAWRTELAAQGEGYVLETCLRSGAFLVNWFVDRFVAGGKADAAVFERLERAALELPIGSDGLLVQPYFAGVMDPHWDVDARGVVLGLSGSHTPEHLYRAIIESMTLDQAMRTADLEGESGRTIDHFVAIGGGARSPLWRQMLADATDKPVRVSTTVEASSLGAAMIAAAGAGWYPSIVDAARAMAGETTAVEPDAEAGAIYAELLSIYRELYAASATLNHRMVAFAAARRA